MTTAEENEILKAVQRDGRLPNDVVRRLLEFHKTRREKRTRDRAETLVKRLRDRRKLSSGAAGRAGQRRDKPGPLPAPLACSPLLQLVAQATEWYGSDETPTFGPQVPGPQSDSPSVSVPPVVCADRRVQSKDLASGSSCKQLRVARLSAGQ